MSGKQKHREDIGLLLNRAGTLSVIMLTRQKFSIASLPLPLLVQLVTSSHSYSNACANPPVVEEGLICSLLQGLSPCESMGLGRIHSRVLREVADIFARLLSIIFKKSCRFREV